MDGTCQGRYGACGVQRRAEDLAVSAARGGIALAALVGDHRVDAAFVVRTEVAHNEAGRVQAAHQPRYRALAEADLVGLVLHAQLAVRGLGEALQRAEFGQADPVFAL